MTDIGRRRFVQGALGTTAFLALPGRLLARPQSVAAGATLADRYPPIVKGFPHLLHGGDWNPDQWLHEPGVIEQDFALMEKAGCNTMSVGIFSWTQLEPEEGRSTSAGWTRSWTACQPWLTPCWRRPAARARLDVEEIPGSAARAPQRLRNLHGVRHNHCFTSPVYREKVSIINTKLAERYKDHPALLRLAYLERIQRRMPLRPVPGGFPRVAEEEIRQRPGRAQPGLVGGLLEPHLHRLGADRVAQPGGRAILHGLNLDWKRFCNDQTFDFFRSEIVPLRKLTPNVPITTNFMGLFPGLNYSQVRRIRRRGQLGQLPRLAHHRVGLALGAQISFVHDQNRSMKGGKPFMLMESTPSNTNWQPIPKLKRPGMHMLSSLQAVAHGSDTVQYFQWRKSRGSSEKIPRRGGGSRRP